MADFKKLSDVEIVETPMDTANVLIEENGVIKRVPKDEVGGIRVAAAEVGQTIVVKAVDENGNPTEWEAADKVKSWNDLEDKPFYDARKQVDKFVIEWDGSIEGREITSSGEDWTYVKATDEVFPYNEYNNGRIYIYSISNNSPMDYFSVNGGLWSSMGENLYSLNLDPGPICIIALSDVEVAGAHFTRGVWYLRREQSDYYVSNMEFENVVVGELKTLDAKYLPNNEYDLDIIMISDGDSSGSWSYTIKHVNTYENIKNKLLSGIKPKSKVKVLASKWSGDKDIKAVEVFEDLQAYYQPDDSTAETSEKIEFKALGINASPEIILVPYEDILYVDHLGSTLY